MDKKNLFAPVRPKKNPFQVSSRDRGAGRVRRSRAAPQLHKEAEEAKKKARSSALLWQWRDALTLQHYEALG
jgi:hypothetical protein